MEGAIDLHVEPGVGGVVEPPGHLVAGALAAAAELTARPRGEVGGGGGIEGIAEGITFLARELEVEVMLADALGVDGVDGPEEEVEGLGEVVGNHGGIELRDGVLGLDNLRQHVGCRCLAGEVGLVQVVERHMD